MSIQRRVSEINDTLGLSEVELQQAGSVFQYFDMRERTEMSLALAYEAMYHHGTAGHLGYMTLAKAVRALDAMDQFAEKEGVEPFDGSPPRP